MSTVANTALPTDNVLMAIQKKDTENIKKSIQGAEKSQWPSCRASKNLGCH